RGVTQANVARSGIAVTPWDKTGANRGASQIAEDHAAPFQYRPHVHRFCRQRRGHARAGGGGEGQAQSRGRRGRQGVTGASYVAWEDAGTAARRSSARPGDRLSGTVAARRIWSL